MFLFQQSNNDFNAVIEINEIMSEIDIILKLCEFPVPRNFPWLDIVLELSLGHQWIPSDALAGSRLLPDTWFLHRTPCDHVPAFLMRIHLELASKSSNNPGFDRARSSSRTQALYSWRKIWNIQLEAGEWARIKKSRSQHNLSARLDSLVCVDIYPGRKWRMIQLCPRVGPNGWAWYVITRCLAWLPLPQTKSTTAAPVRAWARDQGCPRRNRMSRWSRNGVFVDKTSRWGRRDVSATRARRFDGHCRSASARFY